MKYEQALVFLGKIRLTGTKLGLENVRALAARLGNPQERLRFLHLAGTNGKGSVAAFLERALRAGGYRVGLATSPHLVTFGERIRVNFVPMAPDAIAEGLTQLRPHVEAMVDAGRPPTYFEVVVALALWEFSRQKVDWVVWETGLGGRLDATNLVTPEISLITRIGLDHTAWLGDTLAQIAAEKAGIIKPGVPVVAAPQKSEAEAVLRQKAASENAPFYLADVSSLDHRTDSKHPRPLKLGLHGPHQAVNAAMAKQALQILRERRRLDLSNDHLDRGLAEARWPGRFDLIADDPPLVVDGAHNTDAMDAAVVAWKEMFPRQSQPTVIVGFLRDKPMEPMLRRLTEIAGEFVVVGVPSGRAEEPARVADLLLETGRATPGNVRVLPSLEAAWPLVAETRKQGRPVLITGSLFLAGEAMARWEGREHELALNEILGPAKP